MDDFLVTSQNFIAFRQLFTADLFSQRISNSNLSIFSAIKIFCYTAFVKLLVFCYAA